MRRLFFLVLRMPDLACLTSQEEQVALPEPRPTQIWTRGIFFREAFCRSDFAKVF